MSARLGPEYAVLPTERPPYVLERHWSVVERRRGGMTRAAIAAAEGVSIERVRQMEARVFYQLHHEGGCAIPRRRRREDA